MNKKNKLIWAYVISGIVLLIITIFLFEKGEALGRLMAM